MMRRDIKNRIITKKQESSLYADQILETPRLAFEEFHRLFLLYMCDKFLLSPAEITTDDFYKICELSAEKNAKLSHGEADPAQLASKCGGATTAMNKKVLFVMALKREFNIDFEPEESAAIDTFTQLSLCVYEKTQKNESHVISP